MRRSTLVIVIIVIILAVGATLAATRNHSSSNSTGSNASSQNSASSGASQSVTPGNVTIRDMMFTPSQITVQKGATVTWANNDTTTHTVVDDLNNVGGPSSGNIAPGSSYSFKFNKTGSFQYHCSIHPSMRGTIVVK